MISASSVFYASAAVFDICLEDPTGAILVSTPSLLGRILLRCSNGMGIGWRFVNQPGNTRRSDGVQDDACKCHT